MSSAQNQQNLNPAGLLEAIRKNPALYLGEPTLSALWHYLHGYAMALRLHNIDLKSASPLPADFDDWVAYRLHFRESTIGYRSMILKCEPTEAGALERFFELYSEYQRRTPHLIAELTGYERQYSIQKNLNGVGREERSCSFPRTIKLVFYTDDPGFFVSSDNDAIRFPGEGFCPSLKQFQLRLGVAPDRLKVIDSSRFNRLLQQEVVK